MNDRISLINMARDILFRASRDAFPPKGKPTPSAHGYGAVPALRGVPKGKREEAPPMTTFGTGSSTKA